MAVLCSESIEVKGLLEILQAAEAARFKRFPHAVGSFGVSFGGFF
jgi:hypothetical protein